MAPDAQKINPAAWPAPDQLPLFSSYGWQLAATPQQITTSTNNPNAFWSGACDNWPNAPQAGWVGTQTVAFAPTKNFTKTSAIPGYSAPWSAAGDMVVFSNAQAAKAAYAADLKLNATCPAGLLTKVASITDGQSWSMHWDGPSPIAVLRTYTVQRGSVMLVIRVIESTGFGQAPTYDGSADTAALNDIADHLCAYAGSCE